jgi:hypothetical protein
LDVAPATDGVRELTQEEMVEAVALVDHVVAEFGLLRDPRLGQIEQDQRAEMYIVGQWYLGPSSPTKKRLGVYADVNRRTRRFGVSVVELDASNADEFTSRLEDALVHALSEKFPSRKTEVERHTSFPVFGP